MNKGEFLAFMAVCGWVGVGLTAHQASIAELRPGQTESGFAALCAVLVIFSMILTACAASEMKD